MKVYDDAEDFRQGACPFVRNGECDVPPCGSCFINVCRGMKSIDDAEGEMT